LAFSNKIYKLDNNMATWLPIQDTDACRLTA